MHPRVTRDTLVDIAGYAKTTSVSRVTRWCSLDSFSRIMNTATSSGENSLPEYALHNFAVCSKFSRGWPYESRLAVETTRSASRQIPSCAAATVVGGEVVMNGVICSGGGGGITALAS